MLIVWINQCVITYHQYTRKERYGNSFCVITCTCRDYFYNCASHAWRSCLSVNANGMQLQLRCESTDAQFSLNMDGWR